VIGRDQWERSDSNTIHHESYLFAVCCAWYVNQISVQPSQKIMHVGGSLAMSPTITREYLVVDV